MYIFSENHYYFVAKKILKDSTDHIKDYRTVENSIHVKISYAKGVNKE